MPTVHVPVALMLLGSSSPHGQGEWLIGSLLSLQLADDFQGIWSLR